MSLSSQYVFLKISSLESCWESVQCVSIDRTYCLHIFLSPLESFGQNYPEVKQTHRLQHSWKNVCSCNRSLAPLLFAFVRRQMERLTASAWPSPAPSTAGGPSWRWAATTAVLSSGTSWHAALPKSSVHTYTPSAPYGETHNHTLVPISYCSP